MDAITRSPKVPTSYWVVAVLGFLWNCIGAYFYIQARLDPEAVMGAAPQEMRDYVANMPLWANVGYGFGIWGSFAGSVLMLLRSRHATSAFLVSFLGAALSFTGQDLAGVLRPAEPVMILAVIALLWWFCRRSARQDVLR